MFQPGGGFAAMLTPFDSQGQLNEKAIAAMVEFFICKKLDGVFPISNVGEFIQISEDQKRDFVEIVLATARGRIKVTPGISSPNPRQSIEFGKYCMNAGADAVVVSAPFYYRYPPEMVESFLSTVARGVDMPVILYNIPLFAHEIPIDSLRRLLEIDTVVAVKESSGSLATLQNMLNLAANMKRDLRVMVGWEEMLLATLMVGGHGCMVASAGILPELITAVLQQVENRQWEAAAHNQRLIARATEEMKKIFFPYGYKLGMQARGFDMGPFAIDIPAYYAERMQDQQRKIAETIGEVLQEAWIPSTQPGTTL